MKIDIKAFLKPCDCGRSHNIMVDDVCIEKGAIARLPEIMKNRYHRYTNVAVICDENTYKVAGKMVSKLLPKAIMIILDPVHLHADEEGIESVEVELKKHKEIDFLIAVGAGTIHDLTRYHGYEKHLPFLSIPTAASVDGFLSTVAAMTWNGCKKSFTAISPCFVLADSEIFSKAPKRLTASGVGDLLGKYSALCDWQIAHIVTGEYICKHVVKLEYEILSDLCESLEGLYNQDIQAYEKLMYGLLLSGITMQMIGNSRPASGAEHHISHLWEMACINAHIDYYHGEKVGVGVCLISDVYKKAQQKITEQKYSVKDTMEVEKDSIQQHFTNPIVREEILKENTPNILANVHGEILKEKEDEILEVLRALPERDTLESYLKKVNGITTMEELALDTKVKPLTLHVSPYVRQRLTFLRILKFYDFYQEITK